MEVVYLYKISIIIPVFNVEDYIDTAFESILNQTIGFNELEVIFIDDASTDTCPSIIDNYSKKYDNVVAIHLEKNSGAAGKPRNIGLKNATADYIMFLDPDDYFIENACELLYFEISNSDLDIISGIHTLNGNDIQNSIWKNILTNPYDNNKNRLKKVKKMVNDSNFSLELNSIDDYPSIISNFGLWTKIYRKTFLEKNNIRFLEGIPAQDSVFLFEVLLNANGIKFINKVITNHIVRSTSISYEITKNRIKERLEAYYEMFYISSMKDKLDIFNYYLLFNKLNYFIKKHLMVCNLPTVDLLEILEYSRPLFKLYTDYNGDMKGSFSSLFKDISNKRYDDALKFIYGDDIINQNAIKVLGILDSNWKESFKMNCHFFDVDSDSWLNQFEHEKPHFFACCSSKNQHDVNLDDILRYCRDNNIVSIFLNNDDRNINFNEVSLNFDFIFNRDKDSMEYYQKRKYGNVFYLNSNPNENLKFIHEELYQILEKSKIFVQILNNVGYRYIPNIHHLFLCYKLDNLDELNRIYNHFNSINYSYKHIKLISNENNLFLSDSILKDEFNKIIDEKGYFVFVDELN